MTMSFGNVQIIGLLLATLLIHRVAPQSVLDDEVTADVVVVQQETSAIDSILEQSVLHLDESSSSLAAGAGATPTDLLSEIGGAKRTADLFAALGMPWDERRQASAKLNPRRWVEERCGAAFIAEAEAFAESYDDVTSAPRGMRRGRTLVVLPDVRTGWGDSLVGMMGNLFTYGIYLKQPVVFASRYIAGVFLEKKSSSEATRGVFDFAMQDRGGYRKGAKRAWLRPSGCNLPQRGCDAKCESYQYCTSSELPAPVVMADDFQSKRGRRPLHRSTAGVGGIVAPSNRGTLWVWLRDSERDPALSAFLDKIGLLHHPNPFGCVLNSMVLASSNLAQHFADRPLFRELTDPDVVTIMLHIRVGTVFKAMAPGFRGPGGYGGADFALNGATKAHPYEELVDPAIFLPYTECARQIEAWLPKTSTQRFRWFVNSDSTPLKEKLKAAFPERVLTTSTTPRQSRRRRRLYGPTQPIVARQLTDWYQMGIADAFVLGGFSAFGRSAAFRTAGSSSILTIEWGNSGYAGNCHYTNELQAEVAAQLKAALGGARVDRSVFARLAATCDCSHAAAQDPTAHYHYGAGF